VALVRIGILSVCRCSMYCAFYRRRPLSANLSLLALEWANFPLSVGFVFLRMIKLVIAAGIFIGRIDTPFLAPGVGKFKKFELDNYPTIYLKDILLHEAHRHPYIEQLGVMYLMKLRYREHFGKRAGSCWRLLFVYALMPWMYKYRIHVDGEAELLFEQVVDDTSERPSRGGLAFLSQVSRGLRRGNTQVKEDESSEGPMEIASETYESSGEHETEGGTSKRDVSLLKRKSIKLEKENQDLQHQVKRLMSRLSITKNDTSSLRSSQASAGGKEELFGEDGEHEVETVLAE
jgi:hypothetical protein